MPALNHSNSNILDVLIFQKALSSDQAEKIKLLEQHVRFLENKLRKYINENTPSSQKPIWDKKKSPDRINKKKKKLGKPKGSNGGTLIIPKIDEETWYNLTLLGAQNQGSHVDTVVTTDLHRLIRLPNTLHGKTGLRVTSIPHSSLDGFDPLTDGIVFHTGQVEIHVDSVNQ